MRVPINLASQPLENLRPVRSALALSVLTLLSFTVILIHRDISSRNQFRAQSDQVANLSSDNAALQKQKADLDTWMQAPEVGQIRQRSAFLNSIILQKSLSWTRMFLDLEKTLPSKVRITAIRPSMNNSQEAELNLTIAADSMASLIEFLKNVEQSPQFGAYSVKGQRFPTLKDPQTGYQMDVTTLYRPSAARTQAAPEEESEQGVGTSNSMPASDSQTRVSSVPQSGTQVVR